MGRRDESDDGYGSASWRGFHRGGDVDFVVHGIEEYTSVMIVSNKSDEIKDAIVNKMGRGVTLLKGKSGYGKKGHRANDVDVIYSVVTRLELQR